MHSDVDVCVVGGGPGGLCSLRSSVSGTESCVAAPDHNHVEGVRGLINLHASSPSNQVVARITPHVEEEGAVEPSSPELAAGSRLSRARTRFKGTRTPFRVIMQLVGTHR